MSRSLEEIASVIRQNDALVRSRAPKLKPMGDPGRPDSVRKYFAYFRSCVKENFANLTEEDIGEYQTAYMGNAQGVGLIRCK